MRSIHCFILIQVLFFALVPLWVFGSDETGEGDVHLGSGIVRPVTEPVETSVSDEDSNVLAELRDSLQILHLVHPAGKGHSSVGEQPVVQEQLIPPTSPFSP